MLALDVIHRGRLAAEEVASKVLGLPEPVEKAAPKNPLTAEGFDQMVLDVLGALQDKAGTVEQKAIATYLKNLDKRWDKLTPAERSKTLARASKKYLEVTEDLIGVIPDALYKKGPGIVVPTKGAAAKKHRLPIEPSFSVVDEWAVAHVAASQALYVTDANKTRVDAYSVIARDVVAKGLSEGLDRKQIAAELEKQVGLASANRTNAYWQVIASTYVSRARSYSVLSGFDEAGIESYQFEAILDEVTTEVCRFLHGQVFQTSAALKTYSRVQAASDPEEVKELQPWVTTATNDKGEQALYYKSGGKKRIVARVDEPGLGTADKRGTYSKALSPKQLQTRGMSTPPLHGHCRSTIIPVFGEGTPHAEPPPGPDATGAGPVPEPGGKGLPPDLLAKMPPDIRQHVRPMPAPADFRDCDLVMVLPPSPSKAGVPIPKRPTRKLLELIRKDEGDACQAQASVYIDKLNALPKAHDWTDEFVLAPIEGWPTDEKGNKGNPLGYTPKSPVKSALKQPTQDVPLSAIVSKDKLPAADKKKVIDFLMKGQPDEDAVVVGKFQGKFYVLKGDGNTAAAAAQLKGESTIKAHVADIDVLQEKKPKPVGEPKKPKKPKTEPASEQPAPPHVEPPAEPPKPAPLPPPPPVEVAPPTPAGTADNILHDKTGSQRGSNDGGFYTGKDGVKRYVKFYPDETQAYSEHLSNQIYNDLGIGSPQSELFDNKGKVGYSSRIIEGASPIGNYGLTKKKADKILDGFAADVLTGNWDAVGTGFDNVVDTPDGRVLRVDAGGTFLFRAKAGRKPTHLLNDITEWDVFNSSKNPHYSKVFQTAGIDGPSDMQERVTKQIQGVLALEKQAGGWKAYVERHAAGMKADDKKAVVEMLEKRSRKLEEKLVEFSRPKPKAGDVAQFSSVLPRKGLRPEDLPEHKLFLEVKRQTSEQASKGKMITGESIDKFRARTKKELEKLPKNTQDQIAEFTNSKYGAIRESEMDGNPNFRSVAITAAYDKLPGTRGPNGEVLTVYRGITVHGGTVSRTLELHLEQETWGLGHDGKGATSSTTWDPNKTFGGGDDHGAGSLHVVYKLKSKTGLSVESISRHTSEREILMGRNARFRTTGLSWAQGTQRRVLIVEAEELGDE